MSNLSEKIRVAALERLEEAKQRTKEEFTKNINQILQGNTFDRMVSNSGGVGGGSRGVEECSLLQLFGLFFYIDYGAESRSVK